ncbi:MAG TPA: nuclear transport factor 2 family protein [Blastocatellia bacterium]|nr:nuclear transport factor 2 family protein [Blastocatellia bacterium]
MKPSRHMAVVLIATLMLSVAISVSAQTRTASKKGALESEFRAILEQYFAAWSTLNPDNAAKFYAKDAGLVFYDIAPLKYVGWTEYKTGVIKAFTETMSSGKLTPNNDLQVTQRGPVVWTTVTFHLSAKPKAGGEMELDCRQTAIWEKRGGKWLIVHEHLSAPLPG